MGMGYNGRNQYENILFLSKGKRHKPYDLSIRDVLSHKRPRVSMPPRRLRRCTAPCVSEVGLLRFSGQMTACATTTCACY
jgi:hypothetical protein